LADKEKSRPARGRAGSEFFQNEKQILTEMKK
jgi:hypothetical protein